MTELTDQERLRYGRQMLVPRIGEQGQRRLLDSSIVLVGLGALGAALADTMLRAGVGRLRLIDRDFIELSNLSRQRLYTEQDVDDQLPKAIAATRHLQAINPGPVLEPVVEDLTPRNAEALISGANLVLDGTDNFETRFLINEVCHKLGIPWVYAGVVGTSGQTMSILPGQPPCFSCYVQGLPPAGSYDTCDTAGVLAPAVDMIAALAALEGLKILLGRTEELVGGISVVDCWGHQIERLSLRGRGDCPTCAGSYPFLNKDLSQEAAILCGRDAVQIPGRPGVSTDLVLLGRQLAAHGEVRVGEHLLKFWAPECEFTIFADGRAILKGVDSKERARSLYARYLG